jgi:hypothetical protein
MFNTTFNNISVISRRSILLVEEIRVFGETGRVLNMLYPVENIKTSVYYDIVLLLFIVHYIFIIFIRGRHGC